MKGTTIYSSTCITQPQEPARETSDFEADVTSQGVLSNKQFRVGEDGLVHQIGDVGVEVKGAYFYFGEKLILQPTALESWHESLEAVEILSRGASDNGYIYEMVLSNVILSFFGHRV